MSGPRKRVPENEKCEALTNDDEAVPKEKLSDGQEKRHQLTDRFWLITIPACILLYLLYDVNYHTFPHPLADNNGLPTSFSEHNARQFTESVCKFGTRHLGSHANEVLVVEAIVQQIENIRKSASQIHKIELDIQETSGCYTRANAGTYCYANVTNILVRFAPANVRPSASVLVNCHHDTAISSPGASDDMVSCATMLEVLRVLSAADIPLKHSILFLFNGAEETGLQASHGFITQHPWAKELKAFVNLEAAGAGGREMVFQTGPEHPWLVATYAQSVRYPFASVIGQEIFQSGIIPSDTDFRIFRDYGHIPGIDIAYAYNGYIYHTKYDRPEYIPTGCIQRGGENLLDLLNALGNSDQLENPGDSRMGNMVFFDLMGFFMIYYPEKMGVVINGLVVIAVLLNLYRRVKSFKLSSGSSLLYVKLMAASYSMHALGFLLMILSNLALALTINRIRPMMWYTNNWLTIPVYILPAIAIWMLVHQRRSYFYKTIFQLVSVWDLEVIYFDAGLLLWTMLLAILTIYGIASAYLCMLLVVFPLVIRQILVNTLSIKMISSPMLYLAITAAALLLPVLHLMQVTQAMNTLFLPLTGRMGVVTIPDILIAAISLLPVVVISTYLAGFLHVSKNLTGLAVRFIIISIVFALIGCFTSIGFPYSANPVSPSAQRHILNHYWREMYAYDGSLESEDHGLLYFPFDYNEHRYLDVPEMKSMKYQPLDTGLAYSGLPYYYPKLHLLKNVYISDIPKPRLKNRITVLHSKDIRANNIVRHHFNCTGGHAHAHIYISVNDGGELTRWSFTPRTPIPTRMPKEFTRSHYFVYSTSAQAPYPPRQFWLDIKIPGETTADRHWLDIAFGAHYLDGPESTTPELESILNNFPNWTVPLGWVATYQHYKF